MIRRVALLALGYSALTLVFSYPLGFHLAGRVMSTGTDTNLFMWILGWDAHAFATQPFSIFDANIFHPFRHTLAYSENLIGTAIFVAPILWLTDNPVLAMNVAQIVTVPLCAIGAYLLARRVGIGREGAVLAGLIFGFSPARFLRLDQLHLTAIQWIPFSLAFAHTYLKEGRARDLRLATAFFVLQALATGHGAVFLTLALLGLLLYAVAFGEPIAFGRRVRDLGVPGAMLLAPIVWILLPYRAAQTEVGLRRSLEGWGVTTSSFFTSPTHLHQWLAPLLIPDALMRDTPWAYLFPGYLPVLLALTALLWPTGRRQAHRDRWWRRAAVAFEIAAPIAFVAAIWATVASDARLKIGSTVILSVRQTWRPWVMCGTLIALRFAVARRAPFALAPRVRRQVAAFTRWRAAQRHEVTILYAMIVVVSVLLSMGPPYGAWQYVYWLPGLNFIRVPSRFMLLAVLGLAVLAGIGFDRMTRRVTAGLRVVLATVLGAAMIAEFAPMPLGTVELRVEIPPIDRWLAGRPKPFAIAELPVAERQGHETVYMLHSMAHWQKTVHGYSGVTPPPSDELYAKLVNFPDDASLRSLSEFRVNYVVVHADYYPREEWRKVESRIQRYSDWLRLEHVEGEGRVYALTGGSQE